MSSVHGLSSPRSDRVPLRDVQNELLNLQDSPTLMLKHASTHETDKHEVVPDENSSSLTISTDIHSDGKAVNGTDKYQDVILKSFVSLEEEVVVEDEPVMSEESVLIRRLVLENNEPLQSDPNGTTEPDCTEDNQTTQEHADHPYYYRHKSTGLDASSILCQEEEVSTNELGNITYKSLMCLGGEVQVSDNSAISESFLIKDIASGNYSQCKNVPISKVDTDSGSANSQPLGHSYCNWKSLCEDNSTISTVDADDDSQTNVAQTVGIQCTPINTVNLNKHDQADLSEICHDVSSEKGEITFKGLCCSGVEIEIDDLSNVPKMSALNTKSSDVVQFSDEDKYNVPRDDSSVMTRNDVEGCCDQEFLSERKEAVSCFAENLCPQVENVGLETSFLKDETLGLKDEEVHPEIEVMRFCDRSGEAVSVHQDLLSAIALTGSCTPKTPTLSRSVLHDHTAENPMSHLWPELPESPLPPPLLNSTSLANALSYTPVPQNPPKTKDVEPKMASADHQKLLNAPPVLGDGPLQEQLRQMAELLMVASGKMVAPTPATLNHRSALVGTSPVVMRSACVWSTPVQRMERSVNTSAAVEILKEVDVSDASTSTDSLLWNLMPGNMEQLSRSELEQRLTSMLIMVEVLSQQLASARAHNLSKNTSPSDLREKLIQTDHTELRQNGTYKDLYDTALKRIQSLEHDQEVLHSLYNDIKAMRIGMDSFKSSTEDVILKMKQIGNTVNVDQETLSRQVSQMKSLCGRHKETLQRMEQKMTDMRHRMEKALEEKESAFSVTQQLRDYHAAQVAELEHTVGSQQELMSALRLAYPSLVELNRSYMESISAANDHLRKKQEDHMSLSAELRKAQELIQRINPVLHHLHQRTTTAVESSKQHLEMKDRAVEERDLMENELEHMRSSLQDASQQISDLNMQQTIMTSEMSVLREQLNQAEQERFQLQRRSTELSATVTSTLASYAFLEQTLASETSKSQQSMCDAQQATERANRLEEALETSRKQLEEYEDTLSHRESMIKELHAEAEIHRHQLSQLAQLNTDLSSAKEMIEFLQAENEMAREQMEESERLLRCHLQGLRERNLECEDLKLALEQLRLDKESLQEELDSTRDKARSMLLEQEKQIAQASNDVILLNHRVCCLVSILKESLAFKESENSDKTLQCHRHPSSSFVDSIMVAMMKTQEHETESPKGSEEREVQQDVIGSETSAFTRIPPTAHTDVKVERRSRMLELLSDFDETISDLQLTLDQLRIHQETEQQTLKQTTCGLQEALQEESQRHKLEVSELRQDVHRLQAQVEKDAALLQQKAQDERNLRKLCSEMEENLEAAHKYRAENSELRREVADLRRLEQQAQVEAQVLREELSRTGVQSAASASALDEKIKLLREVEKLKANLMETEENRAKVLERAKRHQRVHAMNQSKLERELHLLDDMIERVRQTLSSVPDLVKSCPELQKLVEFLG
ncbi:sperm-associated antigen 5 isoform X2 [Puntigrus tetrazona]|uniref:sperm-associated antigen 5 isoform X2 n=1 Tax=Puntigrus tetrazona TaxID=1606681 RepID=UPI001C895013|nr:sperm-associated antigen 5 isoform X2 [Puntigrus tetrazona]